MSALMRRSTHLLQGNSEETSPPTPTIPPPPPPSRAASHGTIRPAAPEHPRLRGVRYEDAGTPSSPLQRQLTPIAIGAPQSQPAREAQSGWGDLATLAEEPPSPSPPPEEPDADFPIPLDLYNPEIPRTIMGDLELVFVAYNNRNEGIVINPLHIMVLRKGWGLEVQCYPLPHAKSFRSYVDVVMWIMVLFMFTVMVVDFAVNGRYNPLSMF